MGEGEESESGFRFRWRVKTLETWMSEGMLMLVCVWGAAPGMCAAAATICPQPTCRLSTWPAMCNSKLFLTLSPALHTHAHKRTQRQLAASCDSAMFLASLCLTGLCPQTGEDVRVPQEPHHLQCGRKCGGLCGGAADTPVRTAGGAQQDTFRWATCLCLLCCAGFGCVSVEAAWSPLRTGGWGLGPLQVIACRVPQLCCLPTASPQLCGQSIYSMNRVLTCSRHIYRCSYFFCHVVLLLLYCCTSGPLGSLVLPAELQDMASFAVDETDIAVIKESARQRQTADSKPAATSQQAGSSASPASAAAAANGLPASGAPAADGAGDSASPFANAAPAGSAAPEDSPAAPAVGVVDLASMLSMVSCADMRAGEFTYAAWTQEMADMKVRRWKSLMPVLTPNSELTTREMVRVLQVSR